MFEVLPLSSLVEKQQGGGTPPRNNPAFWHGDIPWASVKDFKDDQLELQATEETISNLGLNSSTSNLIPPGTPMVCTRMAVGRCAVSLTPTAINQDVRALYPQKEVNPRYLLRLIASLQGKADSLSVGSTVKGIRSSDFLAIKAHIAPKNEQGAIANILDTLDIQIEKTESLIAKLEKVKEGLLHDLLTRGIDENGQLRPSPEQAPELYKESPLGMIPREWEARPLKDYTSSEITYGIVQAGPHVEGGVPYIRTGDMSGDYLDSSKLLRTSPKIATNYKRSEVNAGDLVISIRATVGKLLPVPRELSGANLTQGTAKIAPSSKVDSHYLMWAMRSKAVREAIDLEVKGSTFKEITLAALRQVPLAAPSNPSEQAQIGKALQDIGGVLNKEYGVLEKLEVKKSGLMDDLLTGRVRVTQLLDQTQATTPA